jgi:hypothetical protein
VRFLHFATRPSQNPETVVFFSGSQPETRAAIPMWDGLMLVYATFFVPVFFSLIVGLNLLVWSRSRINHVFIFGQLLRQLGDDFVDPNFFRAGHQDTTRLQGILRGRFLLICRGFLSEFIYLFKSVYRFRHSCCAPCAMPSTSPFLDCQLRS